MSNHLVWFRSDLRVLDNPALSTAAKSGQVIGLFLLAPKQWQEHGLAAKKIAFVLRSVDALSQRLAALGIATRIIVADRFADAPQQVLQAAQAVQASKVFWNDEIAIDE
ncbi:MAG TPA: deoxyribodipyrimidine photo-lyase, partial [Gammaproteobacteria bacterium]|nr:deoxyribodipyrimidine photo-lyase [Gammaproteobacteria bacterium]